MKHTGALLPLLLLLTGALGVLAIPAPAPAAIPAPAPAAIPDPAPAPAPSPMPYQSPPSASQVAADAADRKRRKVVEPPNANAERIDMCYCYQKDLQGCFCWTTDLDLTPYDKQETKEMKARQCYNLDWMDDSVTSYTVVRGCCRFYSNPGCDDMVFVAGRGADVMDLTGGVFDGAVDDVVSSWECTLYC
ncbi:hypothetical protein EDC01DRAFT_634500 [Geopyxis carbonaria]|nr:hypothetical protein EDC01DRAFT_634500 [Geopyxis carbonaria]